MLYKGNTAKESSNGGQYSPGVFKFKVVSSGMNDWGNLNFELKTWSEDGKEGPKILDTLRFSTESEAMKAEVDRRLTVMLGKPEIEAEGDIVGKAGYVVLRKGQKYLEPAPFGGYFDKEKKSSTGNAESILEAIKSAIEYDYTKDAYAMKKLGGEAPKADNGDSLPF
jgi:hypothetical protein